MINPSRFLGTIVYKKGNEVTHSTEVFKAGDRSNAISQIRRKFNRDGRQLVKIKRLRPIE